MSPVADKKRLAIMMATNAVCLVVAVVAAFIAIKGGQAAFWGLFAAALVVGFGVQIWFIAAFARARKTAP